MQRKLYGLPKIFQVTVIMNTVNKQNSGIVVSFNVIFFFVIFAVVHQTIYNSKLFSVCITL